MPQQRSAIQKRFLTGCHLPRSESGTMCVEGAGDGDIDPLGYTETDSLQLAEPDSRAGTPFRTIGRYRVLAHIATGGMGSVYMAHDPELDRRVAVKLLRTANSSRRAKRRLVREARMLARLSHPNIVQVYDAGEHDGDVFVTMELVGGTSLEVWQRRYPRPSWREVLDAYIEAGRGLAYAHDKDVVHRDIKPANVLRGDDGRVRLVDFGLAMDAPRLGESSTETPGAAARPDDSGEWATAAERPQRGSLRLLKGLGSRVPRRDELRLTKPGAVMGTPAFMAPEQHAGSAVGPLADQYSFCVALYEGLYGEPPFRSSQLSLSEVLRHKEDEQIAPPPARTQVPAPVRVVLLQGLSAEPGQRWPSMHALLNALSAGAEISRARARLLTVTGGVAVLAMLAALAGWHHAQNGLATPRGALAAGIIGPSTPAAVHRGGGTPGSTQPLAVESIAAADCQPDAEPALMPASAQPTPEGSRPGPNGSPWWLAQSARGDPWGDILGMLPL